MQGIDLGFVSQRWQSQIAESPDYTVVPNDNVFRMGMHYSSIRESSFDEFKRYLRTLCNQYTGVSINEAIPGEELQTSDGPCYCVRSTEPAWIQGSTSPDSALTKELRLVHGIGPKAALVMKSRGCTSIEDLALQRRFHKKAGTVLSTLQSGPTKSSNLIRTRLGPSHPLGLIASEGFSPEGIRFIDLETMGIFGRPVILFGIGIPGDEGLVIHQILLRNITEEPAALSVVKDLLQGASCLVSYNGRSFDCPYLNERFAYYGFENLHDIPHFDLLHYSRRFWKRTIPDCKLSSIEQNFLHITRDVDIPGMLVPEWYVKYLETGNCGPLVPIVRHNRQDIASLAHLLTLLRRKARECC